jgi:hypothetical protein
MGIDFHRYAKENNVTSAVKRGSKERIGGAALRHPTTVS